MYFPLVLLLPGPTNLLNKLQSFLGKIYLIFPAFFFINPMLLSPSPAAFVSARFKL